MLKPPPEGFRERSEGGRWQVAIYLGKEGSFWRFLLHGFSPKSTHKPVQIWVWWKTSWNLKFYKVCFHGEFSPHIYPIAQIWNINEKNALTNWGIFIKLEHCHRRDGTEYTITLTTEQEEVKIRWWSFSFIIPPLQLLWQSSPFAMAQSQESSRLCGGQLPLSFLDWGWIFITKNYHFCVKSERFIC